MEGSFIAPKTDSEESQGNDILMSDFNGSEDDGKYCMIESEHKSSPIISIYDGKPRPHHEREFQGSLM